MATNRLRLHDRVKTILAAVGVAIIAAFMAPRASAQECLAGGCASSASQFPSVTQSTTSSAFTTVSTCIFGGEYGVYSVTTGQTYEWSMCAADGGSASYDSQLTLRTDVSPGVALCYSDNFCGDDAKIGWTATLTGTVRVQINIFNCAAGSTCTTLRWRCASCAGSPPVNDFCANATVISSLPFTSPAVNTTTATATDAVPLPCATSGADVWWIVTPTVSGTMNVDTCGSNYDTVLSVYTGACGSLTQLICNDDSSTLGGAAPCATTQSFVQVSVTSGVPYRIRVAGFSSPPATGNAILRVSMQPNDFCALASIIPPAGGMVSGSNVQANTDGPAACAGLSSDVWWKWTPTSSGTSIISTCGTQSASGVDTVLAVYTGGCGSPVLAACNDQNGSASGCLTNDSAVSLSVTSGTTYLIRAASFGTGATGALKVNVTAPGGPPSNDTCAAATVLTLGAAAIGGATTNATHDGSSSCDSTGNDVWYRVTLASSMAANQALAIDTCGSTLDTVLSIYSGACASPVFIACNDNCGGSPCGGASSCLSVGGLSAGSYLIRVSDKGQIGGGAFQIKAAMTVVNDLCSGAISVACGSATAGTTVDATLDSLLPDCTPDSPSPSNISGGSVAVTAPGVWYKIAGNGQTVAADVFTASYNTKLHVYTGTCAGMTCVTANDDIRADFHSKVAFHTVAGQNYFILVSGSGSDTGTFTLNVVCNPTPSNDNCASATVIGPSNGSIGGTTVGATGEGFTANSSVLTGCAGTIDANEPLFDVWYSYTAPCTTDLMLKTCGAFDTLLSVHSGCPTLMVGNSVGACNDDGGVGCSPGSQLSAPIIEGVVYKIRVAGAIGQNAGGAFTLMWSIPDTDGDGTPDGCDLCPQDPAKTAPGACGCGFPDIPATYYADNDGDGFGDPNAPLAGFTCVTPTGYVSNNTDCDDTNPLIHPGAPEICDGLDNDCNMLIDDHVGPTWYRDLDGDGHGNPLVSQQACTQPVGFVASNDDCNDNDNTVYPDAPELCDLKDNDCNNLIDDGACHAVLQLGSTFDAACVQPGHNFDITISMHDLNGFPAAGFQAFLQFDPTKVAFTGGTYTAVPFGLWMLNPIMATPDGHIDLASGINRTMGQTPTTADATLAVLHFTTVGDNDCSLVPVAFRMNVPPSRITNSTGDALPGTAPVDPPAIALDGIAPLLSCPADVSVECLGPTDPTHTGSASTTDNCTASPDITFTDVSVNGSCPAQMTITRTWKATDCAGNSSTCNQIISRVDSIAPIFSGSCPLPTINVNADAGGCTASASKVNLSAPAASDGCSTVTVAGTRSDSQPLAAAYSQGTTSITWTATDACGNTASCSQNVVVSEFNQVIADVELSPTMAPSVSRCITFEFYSCPNGTPVVVNQQVSFTNGLATGVSVLVPCANGPFTCVTAREKLHTLRRAATLSISNSNYAITFTGPKNLTNGNLNDDNVIDILDFGVFSGQFGSSKPQTDCSSVGPDADFDGNGVVFLGDFTFLQINFLQMRDVNCCGLPGLNDAPGDHAPVLAISVEDLFAHGLGQLSAGDLNNDGWLDQADMAAFARGDRPQKLAVFKAGVDGAWFDVANWASGALPDRTTNVIVPDASRVIVDQRGAVAGDVIVRSGGTLRLASAGSLSAQSLVIRSGATLELAGDNSVLSVRNLTLETGAFLIWSGGTIAIDGGSFTQADVDLIVGNTSAQSTLRLLNGSVTLIAQDTFIGIDVGDKGRIDVVNSTFTTRIITVGVEGQGTLEISQNGAVNCTEAIIGMMPDGHGEALLTGNGSLHATERIEIGHAGGHGLLSLDTAGTAIAPQIVINQNGRLTGGGALQGAVLNAGTVIPKGTIAVNGQFQQLAHGELAIEIGGGRNRLLVSGKVTLDGLLRVTLAPAFAPKAGDVYDIILGQDVQQTFAEFDLPALPDGFSLTATVMPDRVRLVVRPNSFGAAP